MSDEETNRQQDNLPGQLDLMEWMPEAAPEEPGDELIRAYIEWHKNLYKKAYAQGPEAFTQFIRRECKEIHGGSNKIGSYDFGRMKARFSSGAFINQTGAETYVYSARAYEKRVKVIMRKMENEYDSEINNYR